MKKTSPSEKKPQKTIKRFSLQFRIQHMVLASSVIILIFTGIPIWCFAKPSYIWWSEGAWWFDMVRWLHRFSGFALMAVSLYHMGYTTFTKEGRREFFHLLPRWKDVTDVTFNVMYFFGLRKERPRFGRYTYYEKFDYWAVYWGCVIMIGTGLVLWFDYFSAKYISWFPYKLAAEVHADEAILAALSLFIWHFYNVHYNPKRFPGTMLWWHGEISKEEMMDDHPLEYEQMIQENKKNQENNLKDDSR